MAEAAVAAAFERGNAAVADGEKCLKKFSFFDKTGKFDDAAECFSLAGKSFLIAKSWPEAGANFARAADIYSTKLKVDHEAASAHQKAAEAYAKARVQRARAARAAPAPILARAPCLSRLIGARDRAGGVVRTPGRVGGQRAGDGPVSDGHRHLPANGQGLDGGQREQKGRRDVRGGRGFRERHQRVLAVDRLLRDGQPTLGRGLVP